MAYEKLEKKVNGLMKGIKKEDLQKKQLLGR